MPPAHDDRQRLPRYRRARIRHFLFTVGPNRVTGGRITQRHLAQEVHVNEVSIGSHRWPEAFDGLRIGHVSDFHLGTLLPIEKALVVVESLRDQEPDLIACTGDLVDLDSPHAGHLLEALASIEAPLGVFLVLGNHDELHDPAGLVRQARHAGVTVLENQVVRVSRNGQPLAVAGIDWARSAVRCARHVEAACGDGPSPDLLLAHNPKAFLRAADLGIPLTLAGHTHGGQIAMKSRPNANLAVTHRHSAGVFKTGGSSLYVTSGIGAWFPLRLNCPPEIAMLTMRFDHEAEAPAEPRRPRRRRKRRKG